MEEAEVRIRSLRWCLPYALKGVPAILACIPPNSGVGRRRKGFPSITQWLGTGIGHEWGVLEKHCCPRGQRQAAAMALRAACSEIEIQDIRIHTPPNSV